MAVAYDIPQLCRDFVIIALDEARQQGRDPAACLQAYRQVLRSDLAPMNHHLIAEIDRALLAISAPVPA